MNRQLKNKKLEKIEKELKQVSQSVKEKEYIEFYSLILERMSETDLEKLIFSSDEIEKEMIIYEPYCNETELNKIREYKEYDRKRFIENTTIESVSNHYYWIEEKEKMKVYKLIKAGKIKESQALIQVHLNNLSEENLTQLLIDMAVKR